MSNALFDARLEPTASASIGDDYVTALPPLKKLDKNASLPIHHMVTRTINGTCNRNMYFSTHHPLHAALTVLSSIVEPTCFTIAAKSPEWRAAMALELDALQQNGTWSIVLTQPNMNIVRCKWVYKLKHRTDGSIERYKLSALGSQRASSTGGH